MTAAVAPSIDPLHSSDPGSSIVRASRGEYDFDWTTTKTDYCTRLLSIFTTWDLPTDAATDFTSQLSSFPAPPHTIQRLSELLDDPRKWYSDGEKYRRALDRVLNVTSTTKDYSVEKEEFTSLHHDSPLIPIPWLTPSSSPRISAVDAGEKHGTKIGEQATSLGVAAGTAPMDAADYGPQSHDVQEAIAHASVPAMTSAVNGATASTENGTIADDTQMEEST